MRIACLALILCAALVAGDKKSPQGHAEDDSAAVTATILSPEQLRETVGSDLNDAYIVLDVRLTPKQTKPYQVHPDDFTLRSESSGEHSGPFLYASQIAGAGALEVKNTYGNRANADSPRPITGTQVKMKDGKADPTLEDALTKRMLAEQTATGPVSGLLIFPLSKQKPKNLILSYKTPTSHLRLSFH